MTQSSNNSPKMDPASLDTTSKGVSILGSTGSIGINTLDVITRHPKQFHVLALSANSQTDRLFEQCRVHKPEYAVMVNSDAAADLATKLTKYGLTTQVLSGEQGLIEIASLPQVDAVMAAIVGAAGLMPSLAAAEAGKTVLLANKEALVMSGALFMDAVTRHNAQLLPIDSEHNAIFQCMPTAFRSEYSSNRATHLPGKGLKKLGVRRILLTASGGPFLNTDIEALKEVSPDQACAHPKWKMGRKISVDSATMMNKGLEVIEACWIFDSSPEDIEVVVHPQSVIHSMVEYIDGSVLAQLGNPDMRTPIAHALAWPKRMESGVSHLDLIKVAKLEFEKPDLEKFSCIKLAYDAITVGGTAPAVLNAANEIAVASFLDQKLGFLDIAKVVEKTMENITIREISDVNELLAEDAKAREFALELVNRKQPTH
ncbi:MAG: 1-deoxy-D-xylulose-5-phosphate reductoisomerase [Thiohalomonadales bacterium]